MRVPCHLTEPQYDGPVSLLGVDPTLILRRVHRIAVQLDDKEHASIWHLHNFPNHDNDDSVPRDKDGYHSDSGFKNSLDPGTTTS
jgi:hypothetical protein